MGFLEVEFLGQWTWTSSSKPRLWRPSIFLDPRPSPATSVEMKIENRSKMNTRNLWVQNTDQRSMMMADRWESVHKMSQEKNMYNNIINSLCSHHSIQQSMRSRKALPCCCLMLARGAVPQVGRDEKSGEFIFEAELLLLMDNSVCCIDEFDKMNPSPGTRSRSRSCSPSPYLE